ncbi:HAMP domain-containing histidine kinase [Candidatus Peregrinibacteria bacterium]|nr:HAMP domain-containing histidine kinase [Candidatus Peregrinibacteria bacterium]
MIKEEIPYLRTNAHSRQVLAETFGVLESDFCMPLCFDGRLSALVFLRRGEDAPPYSREEIKELLKVKEPLEISLMNILLKMNLQEENILMRQIIDRKTAQLRERYQKIKTLSEQQSDFISVTAHELRTPLNIAVFQTRELLNHRSDPEAMAKGLQVVDSTLGNLTSLTQKLFDAQQFDFDKVRLHRVKVDIKKWIKGIHEECLLIMRDKAVNFVLEDRLSKPLKISIDPSQLRQVLHNLVGNAYKFVPAGGLIELECEEAKGGVVIRVGDSGKGIPEALRLSVFDKFRSKGAKSGIGLGLYICKKIIQLHGGKIWVGDSSLGGALFSVFLKK